MTFPTQETSVQVCDTCSKHKKTSGLKWNEAVNGTDDEGWLKQRDHDQKLIYLAQSEARLVK